MSPCIPPTMDEAGHMMPLEAERCIACDQPFAVGDEWLPDASGGSIHFACCGPERESYTNAEGDPLGPDDPMPTPLVWGDDDSFGEVDCLSQIDNMVSGLERPCTCHPDDSPPVPCARRYALTECRAATTQPQEPK